MAQQITEADSNLVLLSDTIARARNGLVQELVEVFSVVEVRFDSHFMLISTSSLS